MKALALPLASLTLSLLVVGAHAAMAPPGPAARYLDRLLTSLRAMERDLPAITAAAEQAADRLVAGGRIFLAGYQGFVSEGLGRAGGMMTVKALEDPLGLGPNDVVVLGGVAKMTPAENAIIQGTARAGAMLILYAPEDWTSDGRGPHVPGADTPGVLPTISPLIAAELWAFTGELVAALTRRGKMPPMYQSIVVPGGPARNASHLNLAWEPTPPAAVAPGLLGRTYLARLVECLGHLRGSQLPRFAEAGRLSARALQDLHDVWYAAVGHMPPYEYGLVGAEGLAKAMPPNPDLPGAEKLMKPGDVIWYVGYYEPFGPWVETAHQRGARIVTVTSGTPQRPATDLGADVNITGCWPYGDALVEVPGYDVKILPPSGVVQSAAYWLLVAETQAAFSSR